MDNPAILIGIIVLGVIVAVASFVWRQQRADGMIRAWADQRGYQIISAEHCLFFRGPYWFGTSKSQMVFRVHIRDQSGAERMGYVRLGGWFMGMMADQVDVTWD